MENVKMSVLDLNNQEIMTFTQEWREPEKREVLTDIIGSGNGICMSIVLKDDFTWEQMDCIRSGFESGLAYEEVMVYASKEFDWEQMLELKYSLLSIGVENTMTFADPDFSEEQMRVIRRGYELGLDRNAMSLVINKDYDDEQMFEIMFGMARGLSKDEIIYANKDIPATAMHEIRRKLTASLKSKKRVFSAMSRRDMHNSRR